MLGILLSVITTVTIAVVLYIILKPSKKSPQIPSPADKTTKTSQKHSKPSPRSIKPTTAPSNEKKKRTRSNNKKAPTPKSESTDIEEKIPVEVPESQKTSALVETETSTEAEFQKVYINTKFEKLQKETETGNVQYNISLDQGQDQTALTEQLVFRLTEGLGEAIYEIGVQPDGTPTGIPEDQIYLSLETLHQMCQTVGANMTILRGRDGIEEKNRVAEVLIRKLTDGDLFFQVRVAVVGNVDTGKSTLLGVLSRGGLDNGRGKARLNIFKHKHEIESGRTSDIGREILGFDAKGAVVNYSSERTPTWNEICERSSKIVSFTDLAGHEKYLKTTVFGLTGNYPDYSMMMVGSNMGVIGMTKEHYHLTLALKVPCFFVVTKVDICPPNVLQQTLAVLKKMLKAPGSKKIPFLINNEDDVINAARNFNSNRIAPIFQISNVTGQNLHLLRLFFNVISPRKDWNKLKTEPTEFHVDNTFSVTGVGTVISGTLMKGQISVNQTLLLGPDEFGKFKPIVIKGIHTNRFPVKVAYAGQSVSLALKKIKRSSTRKGQVVVALDSDPFAVREFDADIFVITHSTTINTNYEAVIHCGCTRQTATIVEVDGVLRAGLRGRVRFRYKYHPEFIQPGERIIFREGKTKGIGNVAVVHRT